MIWLGGGVPYGYSYNHLSRKLVKNEKEAQVLDTIFNFALQGKGIKEIANYLNKAGIKSRSGKKWSVTVISALLSPTRLNFYRGYSYNNLRGNWEALISEEKYNKLLAIRKKAIKEFLSIKRQETEEYLLTKLDILRSGYCKGNAKAVKKKQIQYFFIIFALKNKRKGLLFANNQKQYHKILSIILC